MKSVEKIDPNAFEKPVHSTTRTKISHTWLASHTGPIAQSDAPRAPPATLALARDEAPEAGAESAPPNTAYAVTPSHRTPPRRRRRCSTRPKTAGGRRCRPP